MPDPVPRLISIPPRYALSQVAGYIKGRRAIHLTRTYGERKRNFTGQHRAYIQNQKQEDRRLDQVNL